MKMTVQHLQCRSGRLRYRRKVPPHLRPYLGDRVEVVRALGLRAGQEALAVSKVAAIDREVSRLLLDAERAHRASEDPHVMAAVAEAWALQAKYIGHDHSGLHSDPYAESDYDRWIDTVAPTFTNREAELSDLTPLDRMKVETVKLGRMVPVELTIGKAVEAYTEHRQGGKLKDAEAAAVNALYAWLEKVPYASSATNNRATALPMQSVTRAIAADFVMHLYRDKGSVASGIRRKLQSLKAIWNFTSAHFDADGLANPWAKLKAPAASESPLAESEKALPFNARHLALIDAHLQRMNSVDPHLRILLRVLRATGARLSEITGLTRADVYVNEATPWMWIRPNATRPTLKTKASRRRVPIPARIVEDVKALMASAAPAPDSPLFPKALRSSASKSLNAMIRAAGVPVSPRLKAHSFRHGIVEALRLTRAPDQHLKSIVGHAAGSISDRYGAGGVDIVDLLGSLEVALGCLGEVPEHVYDEGEK